MTKRSVMEEQRQPDRVDSDSQDDQNASAIYRSDSSRSTGSNGGGSGSGRTSLSRGSGSLMGGSFKERPSSSAGGVQSNNGNGASNAASTTSKGGTPNAHKLAQRAMERQSLQVLDRIHEELTNVAVAIQRNDGLDIQDRSWNSTKVKQCFISHDLVVWLIKTFKLQKAEATIICHHLWMRGLIFNALNDHLPFQSGATVFFRVAHPYAISFLLEPSKIEQYCTQIRSSIGPKVSTRTVMGTTIERVFSGRALVDWICFFHHIPLRKHAIYIAQQLLHAGIFFAVDGSTRKDRFQDDVNSIYQHRSDYCGMVELTMPKVVLLFELINQTQENVIMDMRRQKHDDLNEQTGEEQANEREKEDEIDEHQHMHISLSLFVRYLTLICKHTSKLKAKGLVHRLHRERYIDIQRCDDDSTRTYDIPIFGAENNRAKPRPTKSTSGKLHGFNPLAGRSSENHIDFEDPNAIVLPSFEFYHQKEHVPNMDELKQLFLDHDEKLEIDGRLKTSVRQKRARSLVKELSSGETLGQGQRLVTMQRVNNAFHILFAIVVTAVCIARSYLSYHDFQHQMRTWFLQRAGNFEHIQTLEMAVQWIESDLCKSFDGFPHLKMLHDPKMTFQINKNLESCDAYTMDLLGLNETDACYLDVTQLAPPVALEFDDKQAVLSICSTTALVNKENVTNRLRTNSDMVHRISFHSTYIFSKLHSPMLVYLQALMNFSPVQNEVNVKIIPIPNSNDIGYLRSLLVFPTLMAIVELILRIAWGKDENAPFRSRSLVLFSLRILFTALSEVTHTMYSNEVIETLTTLTTIRNDAKVTNTADEVLQFSRLDELTLYRSLAVVCLSLALISSYWVVYATTLSRYYYLDVFSATVESVLQGFTQFLLKGPFLLLVSIAVACFMNFTAQVPAFGNFLRTVMTLSGCIFGGPACAIGDDEIVKVFQIRPLIVLIGVTLQMLLMITLFGIVLVITIDSFAKQKQNDLKLQEDRQLRPNNILGLTNLKSILSVINSDLQRAKRHSLGRVKRKSKVNSFSSSLNTISEQMKN